MNFEDTAGTALGSENTDSEMEMVRQLTKYIKKRRKIVSNRNKIYPTPSISRDQKCGLVSEWAYTNEM